MSTDNIPKRSLDDFKRWKVPELRDFLRNQGLKFIGSKEELVCLAYGAEQCSVPLVLTVEESFKLTTTYCESMK